MPLVDLDIKVLLNPADEYEVEPIDPRLSLAFVCNTTRIEAFCSALFVESSKKCLDQHEALKSPRTCSFPNCSNKVKRDGVCWRHGGFRYCTIDGCANRLKARGLCWRHGGGKPCKTLNCSKTALRFGHCWAHGGGKRCQVDGCARPAYKRNDDKCDLHSAISQSSKIVMC
ncbi:hypothetical protein Ae201684_017331 [Aphanomyces euteiches]|uniref:WRKY19-like zinc finger domain-containing protein n=1 Tax=Aphanomyces euteiches TaxID=100861 RepID=A0A6G0WC38_9STRA|nr:hypothetical protein Ae201684_017331 [Aphanomyces euteiches]